MAALFLMLTPSKSQIDFKIGGGIGVTSTVSDYNGSTQDYYAGSSYGLNSGYNAFAKAKVGLSMINLTVETDYSSLSNSGNSESGKGSVDISQKILSLKAGPEYRLAIPEIPFTPYVGVNVAINRFMGETAFSGVAKVPTATYSMHTATRFGIGCSLGAEVDITSLWTLDFTTSYNFMNISGKEWVSVNPGIIQRVDSYLSLNDAADPQYAAGDPIHFIGSNRKIQTVLFTVGILFGI